MNLLSKTAAGIAMFGALGASVDATARDIIVMEQRQFEVPVLVQTGVRQVPVTRIVRDPCSANGLGTYTTMVNQPCYGYVRGTETRTVPVTYREVEPRCQTRCDPRYPIARGVGQFVEGELSFPGEVWDSLSSPFRRQHCCPPNVVVPYEQ